ncbi:hypothetical protein CBG46_09990 [Actinobacillus succinogenes]|uniref:Uncharacterized protein n=1 Tax=Actinobacillus succinogenes (strain ATCC 55618 / DSM 22257 / CCUG 43843 / 130Z) TaxID=339671 RepID=A6VNP2_ACTSZ|nr:hypothetical protein [Actinobacillus succinogenes]ABR74589.1 hypothetical protein Asuc_1228 [Actinobacillus succinogenes 130Z]PHI40985.1 hypothetical protein CBG46_09990 [Actinobacillus succinogenes]
MIQLDEIDDGFYKFPYRPGESLSETDTPAPNTGGFDLITHPEMIENIPELKYSPMLRKLLVDLNAPESPYMTLGCGYWANYAENEVSYCYLEFSFREINIANNKNFSLALDEKLVNYLNENKEVLSKAFDVPPQAIPNAVNHFEWRYRPFRYFESEERTLLYFQAGSYQHQDLEVFLDILHRFLTQYLVVPS